MARKLEVQVVGDARSLQRAFGNAGKASDGFGRTLRNVGKAAAFAAGGGIIALGYGLKKSVDAAKEAEVSQRRTATQLKALGISYDQHAKKIDTAIQKTSKLAAIDDEELQDSFTQLVRVTGDVNKALDLNALAADIARAKGIELSSATSIVTKAQLGMVGSLKRQGIEITKVTDAQDALGKGATDAQKAQAKAADDQATRLKAIAALQKTFGGQAEAYGNSAAGAGDRFRVSLENIQEQIGSALLPSLARAGTAVAGFLDRFLAAEGIKAKLNIVWEGVSGAAQDLFARLSEEVGKVDWNKVGRIVGEGLGAGVGAGLKIGGEFALRLTEVITAALGKVDWNNVGKSVGDKITGGVQKGVDDGGGKITFKSVFDSIGRMSVALLAAEANFIRGFSTALATGIANAFSKLPGIVSGWMDRVSQAMARGIQSAARAVAGFNIGQAFVNLGLKAVAGLGQGLVGLTARTRQELAKAALSIAGYASTFYSFATSLGRAVADGAIAGLAGLASRLGNAIGNAARAAIDLGKRAIGSRSPSKLSEKELGVPLGEGVIQGWLVSSAALPEKMKEKLQKAIEAGREVVTKSRDRFAEAWGGLSSRVLRAFDAETDRIIRGIDAKFAKLTPSEQALSDISARRAQEDAAQAVADAERAQADAVLAVADAEGALAKARAEGNTEEVTNAERRLEQARESVLDTERRLARAREDITITSLENQAAAERAAANTAAEEEKRQYTSRREEMRLFLENRLEQLGKHFAKEGATVKGAMQGITKVMKKFGVSFAEAGADVGIAFVKGLKGAIKQAGGAAGALKTTINEVAESIDVPKLASGGIVRRPTLAMIGERGPEAVLPLGRASRFGGATVIVNVAGSVTTEQDLARTVRDVLVRDGRNNGGGMFGNQA